MIAMLQVCNYPGSQFRVQGSRLERKRGLGIYNVSDGQFHTLKEIIVAICQALGRKPPRFSVPVGTVRLAAGILEDAGRMIGFKSPVGRATIDKYTEDIAVDGSLIQQELGFVPQYGLKTGWEETVQEMHEKDSFEF